MIRTTPFYERLREYNQGQPVEYVWMRLQQPAGGPS